MMRDESDHDPLDPAVLEAARHYHAPPDSVPREAMWQAILAARAGGVGKRSTIAGARWHDLRRWHVAWPTAIAAGLVLAAGFAIGRWSGRTHDEVAVTAVPGPTRPAGARPAPPTREGAAYQVAVTRDLTQAEALLTAFRGERLASPDAGRNAELASWARDVLSNTRLLLDSPAAADPQRRRLLEDLELVLVQMVELAPDQSTAERQMIDSTLEHDHVLSRLRYAVPAGATGI